VAEPGGSLSRAAGSLYPRPIEGLARWPVADGEGWHSSVTGPSPRRGGSPDHDQASDGELVERARRGELDAYEALVRRYQQLAVRVGFLITGDLPEAEDATQEAFLKAYAALGRVRPASFRPWLLRIVANEARNLRKAAGRRSGALERAAAEAGSASPAPSPEAAVLAAEQRSTLLRALDGLRDEDRLAIGYRYFFDLSEAEMVEALGWRRGTVKSRLSRALGRYRRRLGDLALLPLGAFAFPHVARELAAWSEAELEHGLVGLGQQLPQGPLPDAGAALMRQIRTGRAGSTGPGASMLTSPGAIGAAVVFVAALGLAAFTVRPTAPAPPAPPAIPASPTAAASPTGQTIVVFGGDLSDQERSELGAVLGARGNPAGDTVPRDEVVSTLTAAGLPAAPTDAAVSSVALTCPAAGIGLDVRTEHITMLPPLTYATALLAAGSTDAAVVVAAPAGRPVSGETGMVGMLKAAGRCPGHERQAAGRVGLAYQVLRQTSRLAGAAGDWPAASRVVARAVQAVVTGQARDEPALGSALDAAAADAGLALDPTLREQVAAAFRPLVGQDYGPFAAGYRIEQRSPNEARLAP
jgi:RNA polymerase sigma factor (sigma-70 family)